MHDTLLYLTTRTTYNRFVRQLQRVKQPRYAIAIVIGIAYFWYFLIAPTRGRPGDDPLLFLTTAQGRAIITCGVFLLFAASWISGRRIDALAFSPAEVHFLFPAPVTRRWLIIFKLVRMQIAILISSFVWTLLVRRGAGDLHPLMRAVGFWLLFATISIHQVGSALVHASAIQRGILGDRLQRAVTTILVLLSALYSWAAFSAWQTVASDPVLLGQNFMAKLAATLEQPLLSALLLPFKLLGDAGFAGSTSQWLAAIPFALLIFALHLIFVVRANFAFEESAAEASVRVAKRIADFRARGVRAAPSASPRTIRSTSLPLSAHGSRAVAIIWKNSLAFLRSLRATSMLLILLMIAPVIVALVISERGMLRSMLLIFLSMFLFWSILLGPRFIRNDLRADMAQLSLLKTFPLTGTRLVSAEITSATLALTVIQMALVAGTFYLLMAESSTFARMPERFLILAAAPFVFFAINVINMTIQNGAALLFPAWTTFGLTRPGGVEAMGQGILMAVASVLLLALSLLPAAITATALYFLLGNLAWMPRITLVGIAALIIVFAELVVLMHLLGRVFDRTEPSALS